LDFVLFGKLIPIEYAFYAVRVPQFRDLTTASFRFRFTTDTLAFIYMVGVTNPHYGLAPVSYELCTPHQKILASKKGKDFFIIQ